MKLLYTRENRYLVYNIKNIVENAGIEVMLKNEFAAGGAGDLAPLETWLELWVVNDSDYDKAAQILDASFNIDNAADWLCSQCNETNNGSFEFCWNCQNNAPQ
ncbi:MAG: DUF2007 domain-containing protein [Methylophagaceae bacterium]